MASGRKIEGLGGAGKRAGPFFCRSGSRAGGYEKRGMGEVMVSEFEIIWG